MWPSTFVRNTYMQTRIISRFSREDKAVLLVVRAFVETCSSGGPAGVRFSNKFYDNVFVLLRT